MSGRIGGLDHVAIPTDDPEALIRFYGALGFGVPDLAAFRAEAPAIFHIHFGPSAPRPTTCHFPCC